MISPGFSPVPAVAGGLLIGAAATLLLWLNGRIAGVSGILGSALSPQRGEVGWRAAFLAGLIVGGALGFALVPDSAPKAVVASPVLIALAGLLVGVGTSYGGGCTSGHGVCGLARRSVRSLVATGVHGGRRRDGLHSSARCAHRTTGMKRLLGATASGVLFGFGLVLAGMTNPQKIVGFLDIFGVWDPSLALVMGGALIVTATMFPSIIRRGKPLFDVRLELPTRHGINVPLVAGSALFGIGWGIAGYCPGPALASLGGAVADAAVFVVAMIAGMLVKRWILDPLLAPRADTGTAQPR